MFMIRAIRLARQFARVSDLKTEGQRHVGAKMLGEDFVGVRNLHISRMLGKEGKKDDPPPTATRAAPDKTAAAPTADPKGSSDKDTGFSACACGPKGERPMERAEVARAEEKKQKVAEFMNKMKNVGAGWAATGVRVANVTKSTAIGVNTNQLLALAMRDSIQCHPKLVFHSSTYFQNGTSGAAKGEICSGDKGVSCKAKAGGGGGKGSSGKGGNCSGGAKGGKGDQGEGSGKRPTGAGAKPATTNGQDKPSKKQMERESRVLFKMSKASPQCDSTSQQIAGQKESCKSNGKKGGKPEGTQCRGGVTAAAPAKKIVEQPRYTIPRAGKLIKKAKKVTYYSQSRRDGSETLEGCLAAEERPQPETRLYSEQCKSYANASKRPSSDRVGSKDEDKETCPECPGAKDHDEEICKQGEGKKIESRSASGTKATGASICSNLTANGSSSKSDSNCPKSKPKKDGGFVAGKMNSDLKACKSCSNQTNGSCSDGCGKKDPCKKSISISPEPKNGKGSCKESSSIYPEPKNSKGSCKESSSICPKPKNGKGPECPGAKDPGGPKICERKNMESRSANCTKATGASICSNLTANGSTSKSDSDCPKSKPKKEEGLWRTR